ncbi:MAG: glycosyltransferase family 4 protein [Rikenellaceae bacterium]|nr:glycosyltransferase family 4 protein [Rikenellaceae bacterium]MBR2628465.1 glycosyltransferase family 4 protein [Alistipes sp.]
MKRVLLVTQYFYPENFKSNDIAFELKKRGYCVDALVSIPNYPAGKYYDGYGIFRKRKEQINGVNVYRVFQTPRGVRHSGVKLALNYLTYAFFGTFWALWLALFKKKYDAILVHEPSPILQAWPAIVVGKLRKTPIYTWILDIWPDAMRSGGGVKNEKIIGLIDKFVQWVYRCSDKILISSEDFKGLVNRKADYSDKIIYFPNWCDDMLEMDKPKIASLPEGFRVMMAGNLGSAQDIRTVMQAVALLKDYKDIKWIFVGDGSEREYIESFVVEHGLQETVFLTGKRPFGEMPSYFAQATVMLLTLRAEYPHLKAVVPARLQSYMSAGKAIVGMIDGGSASIIARSECGCCAPAADFEQLSQKILWMYEHQESLSQMGENGRQFYERYFTKHLCIDNLEDIINGKEKVKHDI